MADKFGRKLILQFAVFLSIPLILITIHTTDAVVAYVATFFWGFTVICRYTILFVWASEMFPPGHGSNSITALRATIGTTLFSMNFYFMFSSNSFEPIFQIAAIVSVIVFIVVFILPESPKWLLSTGQEEDAIKSFQAIAKLNEKDDPHIKKLKIPGE